MPRTYQSQAGSSRRALRPAEPEEEEDEGEQDYEQPEEEENAATQSGSSGMTEEQLSVAAAQLVRFSLFHEYKKRSMNRGDIVKHCFSSHSRSFNSVLERARKMARKDFGMDIVELRAKYKPGDEIENGQANGKGKKRAANGDADVNGEEDEPEETQAKAKKSKAAGSKTYALRSKLPVELISAITNPHRLPALAAEDDDDELDEQAPEKADSGALVRLEKGDGTASGNMGLLGIRSLIMSIILAYGRVITDDHLHALLRRLNLRRETVLPYQSTDHKEPFLTLDKYMELLAKQGYLEKIKLPPVAGQAPEEGKSEWRWGSRTDLEISEVATEEFIQRVFERTEQPHAPVNGHDEDEDEQQDRRRRRDDQARTEQIKAKKKERLHKDLVSAAGSALTGDL